MTQTPQVASPTPEPAVAPLPEEQEAKVFVAPQWKLVWWKFRKHKLAMISAVIVILLYLVVLFADFLAPFDPDKTNSLMLYAPPQSLAADAGGIYVSGYTSKIDPVALRRTFVVDPEKHVPLALFVHGYDYKLFGVINSSTHLFGPQNEGDPVYLMGGDSLGRDEFSRMIVGTRTSMTIGLVGVAFSLIFGIILGGVSGYYGGFVDTLIQRVIEFLRSVPSIPLWMGLAAALPLDWPAERIYFAITIILSLIGWTGLARVVRGRFLSLREEDFVMAAKLDGASQPRIIFRHMLPAFTSHVIASITLSIPGMILSETALSFLGLGLREPVVSWGVLLQEAQSIRSIATAPWLLIPAVGVVLAVLSLNFLGDGLRDAADPYSH
jgi:peptide/nickel transport system permease protein